MPDTPGLTGIGGIFAPEDVRGEGIALVIVGIGIPGMGWLAIPDTKGLIGVVMPLVIVPIGIPGTGCIGMAGANIVPAIPDVCTA